MLIWNKEDQELFTASWTKSLSDIFPDYESFVETYTGSGLPNRFKDLEFLKTIYFVLMGEYAASSIAAMSEDLFRVRFLTLVHAYGPQLERELQIQDDLLKMSTDELMVSSKAVYNTALNPSEAPSTDTIDELPYINQQNTTKHVRSKLDAYMLLEELLNDNLIKDFIKRFDHLFVRVLRTNNPLYYRTEVVDND